MAKKIRVKFVGKDAHSAYVALPGHRSEPGIVSKTITLGEIIDYKGPKIHLDLNKDGKLIGIEVLCYSADSE